MLVLLLAWAEGGSRVVAPAGDSLSFASPKESKQRKGDPQSATPALRYGVNLRRCGCGVRCGTHCAAWQLRSDSRSESVHEARALRRACHPATAPPQAQPAGGEQPNSHSGRRCARPSMRCALRKALAPTTKGRAKQWPEWLFGCFGCPAPLYAPRSAAASGSGLAIV